MEEDGRRKNVRWDANEANATSSNSRPPSPLRRPSKSLLKPAGSTTSDAAAGKRPVIFTLEDEASTPETLAARRDYAIPMIDLPTPRFEMASLKTTPDSGETANERSYEDVNALLNREQTGAANNEAYRLVRAHTIFKHQSRPGTSSGHATPRHSFQSDAADSVDGREQHSSTGKSKRPHGGVLSNIMQLYNTTVYTQGNQARSRPSSPKWYGHDRGSSVSLAMVGASLAGAGVKKEATNPAPEEKNRELKIALRIADVIQRQRFILKLCRALMMYGAPTHRLEDYLKLTARALEVDAQFLYLPGCMIIAFDDKSTHTSDVKIVRVAQGCDIGKLEAVHTTYKNVLHGASDIHAGIDELEELIESPTLYKLPVVILAYGVAAVAVGPFGFGSSFIDLPIQLGLGLVVGLLQLVVAARSTLYANVFEILATIIVSFVGRGFGSIHYNGKPLFCFAALAQSPIALILPGYTVLCGALELQNRSIVAGSVRLAYALVYSLFLSFAVTIGSLLYGAIDTAATTQTTCDSDIGHVWRILFVPLFTLCLLVVNQAHPRQWPVALVIGGAGYVVNYFSSLRFGAAQVSNALGAFVIGCLGNLWSRVFHRLAFTAVLPSIWVQVPSGIASTSSLVSGLSLASSIINGTGNATYGSATIGTSAGDSLAFGYAMIQIAIGITIGLAASAIIIYVPVCTGRRKNTGMFTF